jgi:hypothetical protein
MSACQPTATVIYTVGCVDELVRYTLKLLDTNSITDTYWEYSECGIMDFALIVDSSKYWPVETYRDPIGRTLSGLYRENSSIGQRLLYRDGPLSGNGIPIGVAPADFYRDLSGNCCYQE